jgi:hypothetical protein
MQIAVTTSNQFANVRTMIIERTKRMGPDMSVKGEIILSTMSTACSHRRAVFRVQALGCECNAGCKVRPAACRRLPCS